MTKPAIVTVPGTMETIDMDTGAITKIETANWHLMPPDNPDACQICGREHEPHWPHDAQKLYYQYRFFAEHGRWPTWRDAIAHCTPEIRAAWEKELRAKGVWKE